MLGATSGLATLITGRGNAAAPELAVSGKPETPAPEQADLILFNGRITTMNESQPSVTAVAIREGRFVATGSDRDIMRWRSSKTQMIDLNKRTVIPGLNDSHTHLIRGGLHYNMELRWDGVPSLADAMQMLRQQAERTPPQWVRVIGGFSEFQFAERRLPTLAELNAAAPDTPVFVLNLYDRALLNRAALRAIGYTKDTPDPPGGFIERDRAGTPLGLIVAKPSPLSLLAALALAERLSPDDEINSTRQFMRELNRLGITSVIDAAGGGLRYPDNYNVIEQLAKADQLTVRIAYNLVSQNIGREQEDFVNYVNTLQMGQGNDFYRLNGAGENLVLAAADFENFLEPRPPLADSMETSLEAVLRLLLEKRWAFRLHATYNESISRFLTVFERVNQDIPFQGLNWILDHAETISDRNLERVAALGGGIAIQHRMAYQGEYFIDRYGQQAVERTPPIRKMLEMGLPVGGGTDATRASSYNPWTGLYWLVTGKTVGGTTLYSAANRLDRTEALRLWTVGSSWFSNEVEQKGAIIPGHLADLAVLSADYFSVPETEIQSITAVLTIVGGKVVYAADRFESLSPPPLPISPDWSPVIHYGGWGAPGFYDRTRQGQSAPAAFASTTCCTAHRLASGVQNALWGRAKISNIGCSCWAF
ncbi:amidohydrolase [Leptolyngbya sp. FACHB-321]|nr:amidohydrolase [Leptolyngbya sp. FACHB-321]MBD2034474.1 amidohydrolase [Leptolyngbya sp. FACHB-321]